MWESKDVVATIAVKDMKAAKDFYGRKLGFTAVHDEGEEATTYQSGQSRFLVYHSGYAGTNKATTATWLVGNDIDRVVQDLKSKGISFEHYDMPETTRQGDVHVAGSTKAAWFKDPDGNILAVVSA